MDSIDKVAKEYSDIIRIGNAEIRVGRSMVGVVAELSKQGYTWITDVDAKLYETRDGLISALNELVAQWDKAGDQDDVASIPIGLAIRDVIREWTGRTEPDDPEST